MRYHKLKPVFNGEDDADFVRRRERFSQHGVREYVVAIDRAPVTLLWHRLDAGSYRLLEPDDDGIIRSHAVPNLWIPLKALQDRDWWGVIGCIDRGVSRRANFS